MILFLKLKVPLSLYQIMNECRLLHFKVSDWLKTLISRFANPAQAVVGSADLGNISIVQAYRLLLNESYF